MIKTLERIFRYVSDTLKLSRPMYLDKTLEVTGDTTITGAADLGSTLDVTGDSTIGGSLDVTTDLDVTGDTTLQGATTRIGGVDLVIGTPDPDTVVTAPQGSVFFRTNGSGSTGIYTNTDGSTAWTAVGSSGGASWTQAYNATPSGASIDVTSIASGANEIHILIREVSTSGAGTFNVQIGDSDGIEATGYNGSYGDVEDDGSIAGNTSTMSTSFGLHSDASNDTRSAYVTLTRFDGNTWACSSNLIDSSGTEQIGAGAGDKTLSGELDRIRINAGGAATFSAGNIKVAYK